MIYYVKNISHHTMILYLQLHNYVVKFQCTYLELKTVVIS